MYRIVTKRVLDIAFSLFALIIFSPVMLVLIVLLIIQNLGSPVFLQYRPGKKLKGFYILKFKTMSDKKDEKGVLLPDSKRLTMLGKIIRKTSMDELPQLINVIKGDMSLIGPRPLLFKYVELYSNEQHRRHDVRPGITGWAQVNGRNSISWTDKFKLDVNYVDDLSLLLDIKILFLTVKKVLISEGVNQSEHRPMQPFNGKN
mgnify:CR=1 FL=1